jgi:glycosyltransferase involved in cell wall biosynthesis
MTDLTIGVPVYNGADFLDECLANLGAQSYRDFVVLIYDNASTDATGSIARRWAEADPRFHYIRQPHNKGATQNFLDLMNAAQTTWFMLRAHDDLSDTNFLEELVPLIARPGVRLAVSNIRSSRMDGSKQRFFPAPDPGRPDSPIDAIRRLLRSHQSWVYGIWHRETLVREFTAASAALQSDWASDHLTLFPLLIDGAVATTSSTTFIQRIKMPQSRPGARPRARAAEMTRLRAAFLARCLAILDERELPQLHCALFRMTSRLYAGACVCSWRKIMKLRIMEWRDRTFRK